MVFHEVAFDLSGTYNNITGDIVVPTQGVYFVNLNMGAKQNMPCKLALRRKNSGSNMVEIIRDSSENPGVDTLTIDSLVTMHPGYTYELIVTGMNNQGPTDTYSDLDKLTSFSMFFLEGTMNPDYYFKAEKNSPSTIPGAGRDIGPFNSILDNNGNYNRQNNQYKCPMDGYYVWTFSLVTQRNRPVNLRLVITGDGNQQHQAEIRRDHTNGGEETLSRTILLPCFGRGSGISRTATLQLVSGSANKISWQSFLYEPFICENLGGDEPCPYPPRHSDVFFILNLNNPFRNTQSSTATVPFSIYQSSPSNILNGFNEVNCSVSGYYYISLTVELMEGYIPNVYVDNTMVEFRSLGIHRSATKYNSNGADTLSRAGIIYCSNKSFIRVRMRPGAAILQSSEDNVIGSALTGFLIYNWNPIDNILYEPRN